eukprot:Skav232581  [mRNA]  locus=scaffold932:28742:35160:+ [translate_table: standard]
MPRQTVQTVLGCSGVIADESPKLEEAASNAPHPPGAQRAPQEPAAAQAAERSSQSPPRKRAKQSMGEMPSAAPGASSFALQVSTRCAEGLESYAELLEVLSDLSDSSSRQLRAGSLANAANHSREILPVLKSLANRAVSALSLDSVGYKAISSVEVKLQCERASLASALSPDVNPSSPTPSDAEGSKGNAVELQPEAENNLSPAEAEGSYEIPSVGSESDGHPPSEQAIGMGSQLPSAEHFNHLLSAAQRAMAAAGAHFKVAPLTQCEAQKDLRVTPSVVLPPGQSKQQSRTC